MTREGDTGASQPLEFLGPLSRLGGPLPRRSFLKAMGASMALAGLSGCTSRPAKHIVPYVRPPADQPVAQPRFYATAMTLGGVATGLLVLSREGRPIKVEGNPSHPGSLGATDPFA